MLSTKISLTLIRANSYRTAQLVTLRVGDRILIALKRCNNENHVYRKSTTENEKSNLSFTDLHNVITGSELSLFELRVTSCARSNIPKYLTSTAE